jgi:hypothetical protein
MLYVSYLTLQSPNDGPAVTAVHSPSLGVNISNEATSPPPSTGAFIPSRICEGRYGISPRRQPADPEGTMRSCSGVLSTKHPGPAPAPGAPRRQNVQVSQAVSQRTALAASGVPAPLDFVLLVGDTSEAD